VNFAKTQKSELLKTKCFGKSDLYQTMNYSIDGKYENYSDSTGIRLELDYFRSMNHVLLTALGVPLNLIIVIALLTVFVEFLAYHLQSSFLCKIFGLSTKVAYSCLLYNLALALLDRYLAIVRPLFHRKVVTVKSVSIIQTIGAVVIFFLFKWPYVLGVFPLQCDFVLIEGKITAVTNVVLISLIVILNIVVYIKTRHYARPDRIVSVSFMNNNPQISNPVDDDEDEPQQVSIHLAPTNTTNEINFQNQGIRSEATPQTPSSVTIRNDTNTPHHNTCLQIHGGNSRMEVKFQ